MATVQHSAIPDGQRHEPKGISTATNKQVYVANGATSGTWRKIKETDIDYATLTDNKFGWNFRADTQHTSGAPLTLTAATKTRVTNNGLGPLTDVSRPLGVTYSNNSFTPSTLNSSYVLRVAMKVKAAAAAGTPYVIKVTLEGGASPVTFAAQDLFIKGGSYENEIAISFLFFTGTLNTNQPISIFATTDTNATLYDFSYLLQRTYVEV